MELSPSIRWMRDEAGNLRFYKHNHDLYSDELAHDADEIVVLKAIVRIKTKTIVAVPIERNQINEPAAGDWSLGRYNDEAIYAAHLREREGENPQFKIDYPPLPAIKCDAEGIKVIDAGPGDRYVDDFDPD